MDNRPLATSSYKEALKLDVYCFEAFDLLTSHHMLTAQEGEADCRQSHFIYSSWMQCNNPLLCISLSCRNLSKWCEITFYFCPVTAERDFLDALPFSQQCTEEEEELLHFLYENKLKKVQKVFHFLVDIS